eukprot:3584430-Amphidinium_carterae.1
MPTAKECVVLVKDCPKLSIYPTWKNASRATSKTQHCGSNGSTADHGGLVCCLVEWDVDTMCTNPWQLSTELLEVWSEITPGLIDPLVGCQESAQRHAFH